MSKQQDKQRKLYTFLRTASDSGEVFSKEDLMKELDWKKSTVETYLSKQLKDHLVRQGANFRVKREFLRVTENSFLGLVTQTRQVYGKYDRLVHSHVVQYEFLLPLTREDKLRRALDDLFYLDTLIQRFTEIGSDELDMVVPRLKGESESDHFSRVAKIVSEMITGYSISHVSGRFRAAPLCSRSDAWELQSTGSPYIVDETTAVVRFIIPCQTTRVQFLDEGEMEEIISKREDQVVRDDVARIRGLFVKIFAEAVVRTIQGEDVIWLLETSFGRRLYVWQTKALEGTDDPES